MFVEPAKPANNNTANRIPEAAGKDSQPARYVQCTMTATIPETHTIYSGVFLIYEVAFAITELMKRNKNGTNSSRKIG